MSKKEGMREYTFVCVCVFLCVCVWGSLTGNRLLQIQYVRIIVLYWENRFFQYVFLQNVCNRKIKKNNWKSSKNHFFLKNLLLHTKINMLTFCWNNSFDVCCVFVCVCMYLCVYIKNHLIWTSPYLNSQNLDMNNILTEMKNDLSFNTKMSRDIEI